MSFMYCGAEVGNSSSEIENQMSGNINKKPMYNKNSKCLNILSFCIPLVGLIIFWRSLETEPVKAKQVVNWTLKGLVTWVALYLIVYALIYSIYY